MEYTNPATGGPVMPTIGASMQLLRPGGLVVADNTTMTPLGQRPLDLGVDVVVSADTKADLEEFMSANRGGISEDRDGSPVFLARNAWELGYIAEKSPKVKFSDIRERS